MSRRLVLVHGFTQTARSWDPVVAHLPAGLAVERPELPGHGAASASRLGFVEAATALAGAVGGRAVWVGYSMGGRVCLRLALDHPEAVAALVLVSATAGLAARAERDERRRADEQLAADVLARGVPAFLDDWTAQPLFAATALPPGDLAARRANQPEGLAHALRALGTGVMEPLWDRLGELQAPVLLVVGEGDARYRAIAHDMAGRIAAPCRVEVVVGAGHAVPADRPVELAGLLREFGPGHEGGP